MHKVYISGNKGVPVIYDAKCIKETNDAKVPTNKKIVGTFCLFVGFWFFGFLGFFGNNSL